MTEKLHPETRELAGCHYIIPDDDHFVGAIINHVLSLVGSRKRARLILHEDAGRVWGILTPEEARTAADRLIIDPKTGNFVDPRLGKMAKELQRRLGLIS